MRIAIWTGILIGLTGLAFLMAWQGFTTIADRLADAHWAIFLVAVFALPELLLGTAGWRYLFAPNKAPRYWNALVAMWMGSSVNLLLPVATIGGDLVKARQLIRYSVAGADAVASVVLDKTVHLISILLWTLIGLGALISINPSPRLIMAVIIGWVVFALGLAGFIVVQRAGAFGWFAHLAVNAAKRDRLQTWVEGATNVDARIREVYQRPKAILKSSALTLGARMVMTGEVWLAAHLMGYPIGLDESIMLKSLSIALRSAAFVVPGGLGIQEGSFIVLGAIAGLPADLMLSVSLATRLRELVASVPGLLAWQYAESRMVWRG